MADGFYRHWLDDQLLAPLVDNQLSVLLVKPEYAPDLGEHILRAQIPATAIIAEAPLANRNVEKGRLLCDSVTFTNVAASSTAIMSVVVVDNTSGRLVACIQSGAGLGVAPNGTDIVMSLSADTGLFAL